MLRRNTEAVYYGWKTDVMCSRARGNVDSFRVVLDGRLAVFRDSSIGGAPSHDQSSITTNLLESESGKPSLNLKGSGQRLQSNGKLPDILLQPIGVLCPGSGFGLLAVLLGSTSHFGYAAYAAADTAGETACILSIPAPIAKLCLATVDEYLVRNPGRALKQTVHSVRAIPRLQLIIAGPLLPAECVCKCSDILLEPRMEHTC
jgi:hypothetical protein